MDLPPPNMRPHLPPAKRRAKHLLLWPAFLPLIIVSSILVNWAFLAQNVFAAPAASASTPGQNTFQQFLAQGQKSKAPHGAFVFPTDKPNNGKTPAAKVGQANQLPSAEPPTMKPLSLALTSTQTVAPLARAAGVKPTDLKGSDGRLEVLVPTGAFDVSQATTAQGKVASGPFTFKVTHLHGNAVGEMNMLGSYQFQVLDGSGQPVQGVVLRQPITLVYHYKVKELKALQLDPDHLIVSWPLAPGASGQTQSQTTSASGQPTSQALPMTNDSKQHTLTAQISGALASPATSSVGTSFGDDQSPPKPNFVSEQGSSGNIGYSYPIQMAPGPDGLTPPLQFSYSSAIPNDQHNSVQPAGDEGEGWSIGLGSISGGPQGYSISGIDGVSDQLVPIPNQSGFYETEHISHLRIQLSGSCFNVWDTSGNFYQLGCTSDSLQYYTNVLGRTNYRWDEDREVLANEGPNTPEKEVLAHYLQDIATVSGYTSVRDASVSLVQYGTLASDGKTFTAAGTVDFLYRAVNNSSTKNGLSEQWSTAYGTNYNCGVTPPVNTSLRCDDPVADGSVQPPAVMSTMMLQKVETFVGDDSSTSHLDYSYALAYQVDHNVPFRTCYDSYYIGVPMYCAGSLVLASLTPTAYLQGTGHALKPVVFTNTAPMGNSYFDSSETVYQSSTHYGGQTWWQYLNGFYDANTGVGEKITYTTAWNNTHGTPIDSNGDDRHDPLYCTTHTDCTGTYAYPNDKAWSVRVVTQIQNWSADSSSSALSPATTTYKYQLQVTGTGCPATGSDTDCVGDTWLPSGDNNWMDYYDGQFQGFATVMTTSPAGNLTVQHYASNAGWNSPTTNPLNYLSGNLLDEEVYSGSSITDPLLEQTTNTYAGESGTNTPNACDTSVTGTYIPCETVLLSTQKLFAEGHSLGINPLQSAIPGIQDLYSYDDYNPSASGTGLETGSGHYHNLTQDQVQQKVKSESCNPACVVTYPFSMIMTKKWQYAANDQTISGWTYHDINKVSESEIDDSSGHIWDCQTTTYDEGAPSGVPTPAQGLATTVDTYSSANCASKTSPLTISYTGYDQLGNPVVTVDPVAAVNNGLYGNLAHGCYTNPEYTTLAYMSPSWSVTDYYTTCTDYDLYDAQPVDTTNALNQTTYTNYDTAQQDLPISMNDANGQTTTATYSYDANGNSTIQIKQPLETGSYTSQTNTLSTCAATLPSSAPLPCYQEDGNTSLYSGAVSRTFYDAQGRAVETRTPGPIAGDDTVVMTVYNDQNNTVWKSVPFLVADGSGYLDPNGVKDINGNTPAGTTTFMDALGRAIAVQDPNWNSTQEPGLTCSTTLTGKYTSCINYNFGLAEGTTDSSNYASATTVDPNGHVTISYTNVLGETKYVDTFSGVYGGTLTVQQVKHMNYGTPFNKPTAVWIYDLAPQPGQTIKSVATTNMTYDDLGRLLTLSDPDQGNFSYTYDPDGHVLSVTQTSGSSSRTLGFNYDILGRLGCEQTAAPTSINATGACTAGNPLIQNTYDVTKLGTQDSTDFPIGQLTQSVATTYYPDGTSATVTEQAQHDQRGRTIDTQVQLGLPSGWGSIGLPSYQAVMLYNDANQLTTSSTSGYTFTNVYDPTTGALTGLSNNGNSTANLASLTYNEYGQLGTLTYLNGATSSPAQIASETFNYDGDLRPTSLSANWLPPSNNSGTILNSGRTYDNASNVTSSSTAFAAVPGQSGSGGSEMQNFCYNEQNELIWSGNAGTQPGAGNGTCGSGTLASNLTNASYTAPFTYTNLGQIWTGPLNGQGSAQQYLYCNSAPHELTGIYPSGTTCATMGSATAGYSASYDAWGNETGRTYNGATATLAYDALNRLNTYSDTRNNMEQYVYDASGNRVLKRSTTSAGGTTLSVYPSNAEEYDYTGTGTLTGQLHYYALAGHLIGSFDGTNTTYYLTDAQGSVLTSFSQSAVTGEQIYGPYGNTRYTAGTINTAKGYTGQIQDSVTGLDYYNARYYDPVSGLFLSADNVQGNAQGADPYSYVAGNPETKTDPTGQKVAGCEPGQDGCSPGGTPTGCSAGEEMQGGTCVPIPTNSNDCAAQGQVLESGQCVTPPSKPHCNSWGCFNGNGNLIGTIHLGGGSRSGASASVFVTKPGPTAQQIQQGQSNARDIAGEANTFFIWLTAALVALGLLVGLYGALLMTEAPTFLFGAFLVGVGVGLGILAGKAAALAGLFSQEEDNPLSWFTNSDLKGELAQMGAGLGALTLPSLGSWLLSFAKQLPAKLSGPLFYGTLGASITDDLGTSGLLSLVLYFTSQQQNAVLT